jgi:hypothetical protein
LGKAIIHSSKCPTCEKLISAFVGFKKPIAKVKPGDGSPSDWWTVEDQINGVSTDQLKGDNVVTLFLDEDRVSGLHGKGSKY